MPKPTRERRAIRIRGRVNMDSFVVSFASIWAGVY